jgi:Tol biopolymer transport system component
MIPFAAAVTAPAPTLLSTALGVLAPIAIAGVALLLLEALGLLGLGVHLALRSRPRAAPTAALLALAALCAPTRPPLTAQTQGPQVRSLEPQLTRLFSSDSLQMSFPALSPDGRWIVFGTYEAYKGNLWAVSTAGDEPIPLTTGPYGDYSAVFSPSGDRIAFLSNRPSGQGDPRPYVMTVPFDSRTGAAGTPRQVTLDVSHGQALSISPDGEWLVYCTKADTLTRLVVVPSTGGASRTLAEFGSRIIWVQNTAWSGDGRFVYFSLRQRGTEARSIWRVPSAGGSPQELGATVRMLRRIFPDRGRLLLQVNHGFQAPSYEIATFEGRPVARFGTPRNVELGALTPDGHGFVASRSNIVAPIRVVPVAGGPARQLTEAREYDWPLGWSPDAASVFVSTRTNGQEQILRLPVSGGPATQWAIPWSGNRLATIGSDGQHMMFMSTPGDELGTLSMYAFAGGQTRVVTRAAYYGTMMVVNGPGGTPTAGDEFLYLERNHDQLEVRSTPPKGPSHLLRAFPASYAGSSGFAVHENCIAWSELRGDSTAIFVAEGRNGRARHLVTVAGSAQDLAFSHDGRWLALDHYPRGQTPAHDVMVIPLGPNATLAGPPRVLETGAFAGWQIEWLPDDRALTVFGMTGMGNETHVLLVSLREGERPVAITRDDPSIRWGYSLSPDGRYVAYPAEISRGSSIWRVDLGDVLTDGPRTFR